MNILYIDFKKKQKDSLVNDDLYKKLKKVFHSIYPLEHNILATFRKFIIDDFRFNLTTIKILLLIPSTIILNIKNIF